MIRSFATILIVLAICLGGSSSTTHAKDTKQHLGLLERLETSPVSSIENYILDQILDRIQSSRHTTDNKDEKKDKTDQRRKRKRRLEGGTPTSAPVKHKKSNEKTSHKKTATTESSGSMSSSSGSSTSSSSNSSSSGSTSSSSSNTFTSSGGYSEAVSSTPTLSYINGQSYSFVPFLSVAIAIGMIVVAVAFIRSDGKGTQEDNEHQLKGSVHKRYLVFSNYMADMDGRSIESSADNDLLPSRKGPLKKLGKSLKKLFSKRKQGSVSSDSVSEDSGIYTRDETTTSVLAV